ETTGVLISTKGGFGCELAGKVDEKFNNKTAIVTGTFAQKDGVEVRSRRILTVDSIKPTEEKPDENYGKAKIKGKVQTGIVAPGGATTGVQITAGNVAWELDSAGNKDVAKQIEELNGKTALVEGTVEMKKTASPRMRTIVTVTSIKAGEK